MRAAPIIALLALACSRPVPYAPPAPVDVAMSEDAALSPSRLCCECDVRDGRGDLIAACHVPCERCLLAYGEHVDAAYYRPWTDFAAVADFGACECVGVSAWRGALEQRDED